jgi:LAO/AO transport system kinase
LNRKTASADLVPRVKAGEPAAIARLISRAEQGTAETRAALSTVYKLAGRAHVVGITGVPGSGKSTLVAKLTEKLREKGGKVGIIAVDPSSPYSGGSILGDRIRMTDMATDPGVYIRSMATHGATGGMAHATLDAVDILDVAGFDTIIVETVGIGQDEVEIVKASHTTIVVSAPGLGDEVQAIKAGVLEIADVHVVSKCDRSDANRAMIDLKQMLMHGVGKEKPAWAIPVIGTSAVSGTGFNELLQAIEEHRKIAFDVELGQHRRMAIAQFRLRKTAENILLQRFADDIADENENATLVQRLMQRETDPYSVATEFLDRTTLRGWQGVRHEQNARSKIA